MEKPHKHRIKDREIRPFFGPLLTTRPNVKAHGGVTYWCRCRCGAECKINVNQGYTESGVWIEVEK